MRRRFDTFRIPAIAEPEDRFIVRHEIDFELTEAYPTYHLFISRLHKASPSKLLLEMKPCRLAREINDEINVIGGAHVLKRYWIFRSGDGEHGETGSHQWFLHGIFG
ncbi:hypothetical protein A6U85_25595 [Agrobacterium sp. 13-626]|nr:hypothetical protein A6U85_25595 [Agrobacterium sp. 13-626]